MSGSCLEDLLLKVVVLMYNVLWGLKLYFVKVYSRLKYFKICKGF